MITPVFELSVQLQEEIQHWIDKFPAGREASAILMALRLVQDTYGYLQDNQIDAVADFLGMPRLQAQQVANFYSMYRRKPCGKYVFKVCRSVSCHLQNANHIIETIQQTVNIGLNETSACGQFTLEETTCLGACCQAPCLIVNNDLYHLEMTPEKTRALIQVLQDTCV